MAGTPPNKRNVNTVFQSYALFPHLTVFDNVAFGLRRAKVDRPQIKKRVSDILDQVQLSRFASRKPAQLSGGQQQWVALAPRVRPEARLESRRGGSVSPAAERVARAAGPHVGTCRD